MKRRTLGIAIATVTMLTAHAAAQEKLTASDEDSTCGGLNVCDRLAFNVAISGDVAVLGCHGDDDGGVDAGAAYVYEFDGTEWIEVVKLTATPPVPDDWFGYSVAIDGDRIVVGAPAEDDTSSPGSVYVFENDGGWTQTAHIPSPVATTASFGISVALQGDTIVVGAEDVAGGTSSEGAVFVYALDGTWGTIQNLVASDAATADWFGSDVAIDGNMIVVGAVGGDKAYVYDTDSWTETILQGQPGTRAGASVDIDCRTVVVGAPMTDIAGATWAGAVLVWDFDGTTWGLSQTLVSPLNEPYGQLGASVAVDDQTIVSGAWWELTAFPTHAVVYKGGAGAWAISDVLEADDTEEDDWFGRSIAIDARRVVVGAPRDTPPDAGLVDAGSAYVFELECWADLDGDGTVAIGDLLLILGVFGVAVADDCAAEPMDFDDDGWVRTSDLLLWLSEFGNECE